MDPIKALSTVLFLTVSFGAFVLMSKTRWRECGRCRDPRGIVKAAICWSLGMAALGMALHPEADALSSIYMWWCASVAAFVGVMVYDKLWPRAEDSVKTL
jgi:hypothetical protein